MNDAAEAPVEGTGSVASEPKSAPKAKKSVALSGVTAGNTALCTVGRTGNDLHYRGYDILDVAEACEFEEIAHLLVHGTLPNAVELRDYKTKLRAWRGVPNVVLNVLEELPAARAVLRDAGVAAELSPFFDNVAALLARAHLVIARAGASTVCELAVAGRPASLIPLSVALDDDQGQNAKVLADAGGAEVALESALTQPGMTAALKTLLSSPARLAKMAAAARRVARPDAAVRLADLVERTAAG